MRPNSFHGCLSDPPYGLSFMGKQWDKGVPSAETWAEVLRVLKPGSFLLAFGGTRTYHRLTCAIEDAGFEIRDCLMWLYGSGFPKSHDVSKAIDKAAGEKRPRIAHPRTGQTNAYGSFSGSMEICEPATPDALRFSGYGTALKPAWEPIIVAMKPCEGTFAQNAVTHGVAGLNIEAGRIAGVDTTTIHNSSSSYMTGRIGQKQPTQEQYTTGSTLGRWPANVLMDENAAAMLDEQSGESKSRASGYDWTESRNDNPTRITRNIKSGVHFGDSGGASRFFYVAKASRKERGEGNTHPTVKPIKLAEYLARLILPPDNGRLLIPFSGSGSEMLGAKRAGWRSITGIELNPEYTQIAEKRLAQAA
jgi:DNA modification methylase